MNNWSDIIFNKTATGLVGASGRMACRPRRGEVCGTHNLKGRFSNPQTMCHLPAQTHSCRLGCVTSRGW